MAGLLGFWASIWSCVCVQLYLDHSYTDTLHSGCSHKHKEKKVTLILNSCCFLALFLKMLVCFEHRWNHKVCLCTLRKDSVSSALHFDCLTKFSEWLCTDWLIVNLVSASAPSSAYPPPPPPPTVADTLT